MNNSIGRESGKSCSQTCIKRSPLEQGESGLIRQVTKWPYKTGDLLIEVQFIRNFISQDKNK